MTRPLTATTVGELPCVMTTVRPRLPFCLGMREICTAGTGRQALAGMGRALAGIGGQARGQIVHEKKGRQGRAVLWVTSGACKPELPGEWAPTAAGAAQGCAAVKPDPLLRAERGGGCSLVVCVARPHPQGNLCNVACAPVFTLCECGCLVLIAKQEVHKWQGVHEGLLERRDLCTHGGGGAPGAHTCTHTLQLGCGPACSSLPEPLGFALYCQAVYTHMLTQ